MKKSLISSKLVQEFDGFVWIPKVAELCGFNPMTNEYVCIEDGTCASEDGVYHVSLYKLLNQNFNPYGYYKRPDISDKDVNGNENKFKEAELIYTKTIKLFYI